MGKLHTRIAGLRRLTLALAGAALLGACAAPAPPMAVSHDWGLVRAESQAEAVRFGDLVGELQPRILEVLPGTEQRETEVWVQHELRHRMGQVVPSTVKGFTLVGDDNQRGRIHLRSDTEFPQWFLAHELVHALVGPDWKTLPGALEEGLCDVVAAQLTPEASARIRALRAVEGSIFCGRMPLTVEYDAPPGDPHDGRLEIDFHYDRGGAEVNLEELLSYDTLSLKRRWKRLPDCFYGIGFVVVERIRERHGLGYLHELCLRAADEGHTVVPYQWLAEAAGIDDVISLRSAPTELLGPAEFEAWRELVPGFHAYLATQVFSAKYGDLGAAGMLEALDPRVLLHDGSTVHLAAMPGIADELSRRWPTAGLVQDLPLDQGRVSPVQPAATLAPTVSAGH
ncbi:hypothetical protein [Engelhardtia mirabilis]|uniref:DUF1570 domain-containing protein n=1 Tax=Engelhardtia mirabilis TaxID=2528011 RepID=A0A518BH28_9BACT|nr:hypothetical protein Pla133_13540 [Planctomycetes bacterium Pla133]QDV00613.1 hypothetical protein Pla86_13530 [Planctomycetes bacterium Pla86]